MSPQERETPPLGVRVAQRLLHAIQGGRWLFHLVPFRVHTALLGTVHAHQDRVAAAVYRESSERARLARAAQREAMGPGCFYCPNEALTSYDDDGDRYRECPVCGATWPIGPSPDPVDNPYDEPRPFRRTV